jgi:hypothetical protein
MEVPASDKQEPAVACVITPLKLNYIRITFRSFIGHLNIFKYISLHLHCCAHLISAILMCFSIHLQSVRSGLDFRELSPLRIAATIHAQRFAVVSQQVNLPGGVASPSELQLASTLP